MFPLAHGDFSSSWCVNAFSAPVSCLSTVVAIRYSSHGGRMATRSHFIVWVTKYRTLVVLLQLAPCRVLMHEVRDGGDVHDDVIREHEQHRTRALD